jgi:hypothetical protein
MFGTNIMMTHAAGFFNGEFKNLLRSWREVDLAAPVLAKTAHPLYHLAHAFWFQSQLAQYPTGNTALFLD